MKKTFLIFTTVSILCFNPNLSYSAEWEKDFLLKEDDMDLKKSRPVSPSDSETKYKKTRRPRGSGRSPQLLPKGITKGSAEEALELLLDI